MTWTGGKVPTGEDAVFQFLGAAEPSKTYTKVRQTYSDGSVVDWSGPESSDTPGADDRGEVVARRRRRARRSTIVALVVGALALVLALVALVSRREAARWREPRWRALAALAGRGRGARAAGARVGPRGARCSTAPAASGIVEHARRRQVALTYSEAVEPRFAIVSVTDADGSQVTTGRAAAASPANPDTLVVPLKRPRPRAGTSSTGA